MYLNPFFWLGVTIVFMMGGIKVGMREGQRILDEV
jgi:hypothetical protein